MTAIVQTSRRLSWSGALLGFALGGFFDGILLHQILQWHHLLSLVDGVGDLRTQVLFDGLFHAFMYVVAALGLVLLLRGRSCLHEQGAAKRLTGSLFAAFGSWHMLDGILSHWVLGIHRVRLDSPDPLFWDLLWFIAFGILPLLIGVIVTLRRADRSAGSGAAMIILSAVLIGGYWSAQQPAKTGSALVIFRPGLTDGQIWTAIHRSNGSLLWTSGGIWAIQWEEADRAAELYGSGALLVSGSLVPAGCLSWTSVST